MDDLNQENDEEMKEKLESAIQEALDDETYRKVKRVSYQSHNADEVRRFLWEHNIISPKYVIYTIFRSSHLKKTGQDVDKYSTVND